MKIEDFDKTKEELKKEIQKNNKQIAISDERKRMASVNQFEHKVTVTLAFSLLPYLGLLLLLCMLTKNGFIPTLTGSIPVESIPFIIVGSSLGVGTIGRKILDWKFKIKERLKKFTIAKTQSEKIQEEVKYTVEIEKANNRNRALKQTINSLCSKQEILNSLANSYDIKDKNIPETEEDSKKIIEDSSILLKDKYNELDLLTLQKVLDEKFWRVREKSQKVIDVVAAGLMGGFFTMMYGSVPLLMLKEYITSLGLVSLLGPFVIGTIGVSGYMIKRGKDYAKAFNNLNNKLGENSLPVNIKDAYEEQQEIDYKIESKIKEISTMEMQLQEQKRIMESFLKDNDEEAKALESIVSKEHIIEEPENDAIFGYNQELMSLIDEEIFKEEKELEVEEKGPSLVLKKNLDNQTHLQK